MKERLFVLEYLSDEKLNATKAAIRAGYAEASATQAASRLLRSDNVRRMIDEIIVGREIRLQIKQDQVLLRLHEIQEAKHTDYIKWGHEVHEEKRVIGDDFDYEVCTEEGLKIVSDAQKGKSSGKIALVITHRNTALFKPSDELSDGQARAISEISIGKDGQMKLKLESKVQANKHMGDHLGMFRRGEEDPDKVFRTSFQRMLDEIRDDAPALPFKKGI